MKITNKASGQNVCLSANSGKSGSSKAWAGGLFYMGNNGYCPHKKEVAN